MTVTRENAAQTVLAFTWNDASRYAAKTVYTLELTLKDAPVAKTHKVGGIASNSHSFTGAELQELIVGEWGAAAGETVTVTARVTAVSGTESVNLSAVVPVRVTTYATLLPLMLSVDPQTLVLDEAQAAETGRGIRVERCERLCRGGYLPLLARDFGRRDGRGDHRCRRHGENIYGGCAQYAAYGDLGEGTRRRITLEARVAAYVGEEQQAISAVSYIDVTPYGATPVFASLALFGSATPGGTGPRAGRGHDPFRDRQPGVHMAGDAGGRDAARAVQSRRNARCRSVHRFCGR